MIDSCTTVGRGDDTRFVEEEVAVAGVDGHSNWLLGNSRHHGTRAPCGQSGIAGDTQAHAIGDTLASSGRPSEGIRTPRGKFVGLDVIEAI